MIGIGWMLGWPPVQPPSATTPQDAAVTELTSRVAGLEQRIGRPDPAVTGRLDAADKAIAAVRNDIAGLRAQSDKTIAALNDVKAQPRDGAASAPAPAPVDLSGLIARIDALERTSRSQSAALAQESQKLADAAKPADDAPLRRVVAAALLDVAVRHGDPYAAALSTAKSLAPDAAALKPLDAFAATGVPSPAALSRDLLTIVPKLAPPAPEGTTGSSILSKLSAGAAGLVQAGYLASSVLFIGSISGLASQATARMGNMLGILGVGSGVLASLLAAGFSPEVLAQFGGLATIGALAGAFIGHGDVATRC
ncbi:MAG: NAD(P)(+) transhydrogenase (Re/Si-specific) subunit beta [Bradyrhizobium sp.]|nr:NAD(P)(+) transhydrogenase (Re/Si-specific) subunit beta [Bradyrhizobium sp.]